MSKEPQEQGVKRLPSIDALRGIAATSVVFFHALHSPAHVGADKVIGRLLAFPLQFGFAGVYLFFVISGYCIHLRWATRSDEVGPPFLAFWRRRLRRLYPAYLASMGLYLTAGWLFGKLHLAAPWPLDLGLHLLLAQNLWPASCYTISGVYWTLAIEEQLYLAYFLLLWLRRRLAWPVVLALVLGVRIAWFAAAWVLHRAASIDIPVTEATAAVWICWVLGALAVEAREGRVQLPAWTTRLPVGLALLLLCAGLHVVDQHGPPTGLSHSLFLLIMQPLWSFAFFVIVNAAVRAPAFAEGSRVWRFWVAIGGISYSLYLLHELIVRTGGDLVAGRFGWSPGVRNLVAIVLGVPLAMGLSWLFFLAFERPFLSASAAPKVPAAPPSE